jgi:hypothetical protein
MCGQHHHAFNSLEIYSWQQNNTIERKVLQLELYQLKQVQKRECFSRHMFVLTEPTSQYGLVDARGCTQGCSP